MKIAVIGAGWWGKNIIKTLDNLETVEQVYVFDNIVDAYTKIPSLKKVTFCGSLSEILQDKDIKSVCIATPPTTHFELSKEFLLAGKNILVEKPPVLKLEELNELRGILEKTNRVFMLDALFLFLGPIKKLKELILNRFIDKIKFVEVYRNGDELRREGAGLKRIQTTMFDNKVNVIDDLFFHDAGILIDIFGDLKTNWVNKQFTYNHQYCDTVRFQFLTPQGFPVELSESWITERKRGIKVYCENYILEYDGFAENNQISVYNLTDQTFEYLDFTVSPPLTLMLEYFLNVSAGEIKNSLGIDFITKITTLWINAKDE